MSEKEVVFSLNAVVGDQSISNIEIVEARLKALHDLSELTVKVKLDDSVDSNLRMIEERLAKIHERSEITLSMKLDGSVNSSLQAIEDRLDRIHQKSRIDVRQGQPREPNGRFASNNPPPSQRAPTQRQAPKPVQVPKPPAKQVAKLLKAVPGIGRIASVADTASYATNFMASENAGNYASQTVNALNQVASASPGFVDTVNGFANGALESLGLQEKTKGRGWSDVDVPTAGPYAANWQDRLSGHGLDAFALGGLGGVRTGAVAAASYAPLRTATDYLYGDAQAEYEANASINRNEANAAAATARVPMERKAEEERIRRLREDQNYASIERSEGLSVTRGEFGMEMGSIRRDPSLRNQSLSLDRLEDELKAKEDAARGKASVAIERGAQLEKNLSWGNTTQGDATDAKAAMNEGKQYLQEAKELEVERNKLYERRLGITKEISQEEQRASKESIKALETELREIDRKQSSLTKARDKAVEQNEQAGERFAEMGALDQTFVLRAKAKSDRGETLDATELKALKQLGPSDTIENIRKQSYKGSNKEQGFTQAFGDQFSADIAHRDAEISGFDVKKEEATNRKAEIEKQIESIKDTEREATEKIEEALRGLGPAVAASFEKAMLDIVRRIERGIEVKANGG